MNIEELIAHTNIIVEEGLDSEDDIQLILKKWKTAYEKEKEANKRLDKEAQGYLEELAGDGSMNIRRIQELEAELEKEKEKNKELEKQLQSTYQKQYINDLEAINHSNVSFN